MVSTPLVSVIIPTYNRARFLPNAIDSVLNQTYPSIEILVIDDGSTDNTSEALKPYNDKIRYLSAEHRGTAHARNLGMQQASGKYIAFLDSDDIYLPFKIALQVEFIESHPKIGMVCSDFSGKYADGRIDESHLRNYHTIWDRNCWQFDDVFENRGVFESQTIDKSIEFFTGNVFRYVILDSLIPTNTILIPRAILPQVGYQNEAYITGQEYEFSVRICKYFDIAYLNIPTYVLLHHPGQSTAFLEANASERKKKLLKLSETDSPFLGAVMNWAFNDPNFYRKNKAIVDRRIAEIYMEYAWFYLDTDRSAEAREYLHKIAKLRGKSALYYFFTIISFEHPALRHATMKLVEKIKKWAFLIKIARVRGISVALEKIC